MPVSNPAVLKMTVLENKNVHESRQTSIIFRAVKREMFCALTERQLCCVLSGMYLMVKFMCIQSVWSFLLNKQDVPTYPVLIGSV